LALRAVLASLADGYGDANPQILRNVARANRLEELAYLLWRSGS
jgi:hypothetical protein